RTGMDGLLTVHHTKQTLIPKTLTRSNACNGKDGLPTVHKKKNTHPTAKLPTAAHARTGMDGLLTVHQY
ncbi:MAG: hypothetical protein PUJ24_06515, partial [Bacteroidales bacterium]|nr:hypothetical protein [Bacteroidales bacterium]